MLIRSDINVQCHSQRHIRLLVGERLNGVLSHPCHAKAARLCTCILALTVKKKLSEIDTLQYNTHVDPSLTTIHQYINVSTVSLHP